MSHRVTDEMVDAFRRAYREWWKAATPIPLGEAAVSAERDAVVAGLRAAFGVPVPSEPPAEIRPAQVWVCGAAHADRQCTSRNPHRSRVCGWRMAEHQREQL